MKTKPRPLTPKGVANVLVRGIQETFSKAHQIDEIERLATYFAELAMKRDVHYGPTDPRTEQAMCDQRWLDDVAFELEEKASKIMDEQTTAGYDKVAGGWVG